MSLYEHSNISIDSLERWVNSLSVDRIDSFDFDVDELEINSIIKEMLRMQLSGFVSCINQMKDGDDWRNFQGIVSDQLNQPL